MQRYVLSAADFAAFQDTCANPPAPTDKLRALMGPAVLAWNETLTERIPDDIRRLVEKLG